MPRIWLSLVIIAAWVCACARASLSAPSAHRICVKTTNTPTNRQSWGKFNVSTNYYEVTPDTGCTVEYWFDLIQTKMAPDGVERDMFTVNGTYPAPTIIANWGDTVVVHVRNSLKKAGTGIHFHGVRQLGTNDMDDVPSVTQCPVQPGRSITYTWRATQYGHSWYHSHYELQAWQGIAGGILINGPSTANYDHDLGVLFLTDWTHQDVDHIYEMKETNPTSVNLENGLINGTNIYNTSGDRFQTTFTPGESYRLRLINNAVETMFAFMIDNHTLTVMAVDFVPIAPYQTTALHMHIGQRYDVVVEANAVPGDYWIRTIPLARCSSLRINDITKGILRYDLESTAEPKSIGISPTEYKPNCTDEDLSNLVPYLKVDVGDHNVVQDTLHLEVLNSNPNNTAAGVFRWFINGKTYNLKWENPTLLKLLNNSTSLFTSTNNTIQLHSASEWAYVIIQSSPDQLPGVDHPIHLHGHDFHILAQGFGLFNTSLPLNLKNPPRRDVKLLPRNGHLVLAFPADNPGAWLMHCHIGFHQGEGLDLQVLEGMEEVEEIVDGDAVRGNCEAWGVYARERNVFQTKHAI